MTFIIFFQVSHFPILHRNDLKTLMTFSLWYTCSLIEKSHCLNSFPLVYDEETLFFPKLIYSALVLDSNSPHTISGLRAICPCHCLSTVWAISRLQVPRSTKSSSNRQSPLLQSGLCLLFTTNPIDKSKKSPPVLTSSYFLTHSYILSTK